MFFKKEDKKEDFPLSKIGSLLIHAAKIDENYSSEEEEIIKKTLISLGAEPKSIEQLIKISIENEEKSNQILEFTKEVKNLSDDYKTKIIEALWRIIYSNKNADIYETNLMRRLTGLLYIDSKIMGDIKEKIKKEYS
ncbi:TerB family tellurite resistance protein [Candidatus Pelagibacter sp.]|uniref:tellurite resistance TerB family protein n=1 Tax=Candidatus Pelagibacter sp. TaxID=2024849 RepID=UPI003F84F53A